MNQSSNDGGTPKRSFDQQCMNGDLQQVDEGHEHHVQRQENIQVPLLHSSQQAQAIVNSDNRPMTQQRTPLLSYSPNIVANQSDFSQYHVNERAYNDGEGQESLSNYLTPQDRFYSSQQHHLPIERHNVDSLLHQGQQGLSAGRLYQERQQQLRIQNEQIQQQRRHGSMTGQYQNRFFPSSFQNLSEITHTGSGYTYGVQGRIQNHPDPYELYRGDPNYSFVATETSEASGSGPTSNRKLTEVYDPTGQTCPPGGHPRVTTTLWEDESTLCFQVEARGVCVARREDNNMINGTKLFNLAGISRGKRDGLLKHEPHRQVIKMGAMHLKGVWIPYQRALEFANQEKITDLLYPLFVKHIKMFLYHPENLGRTHALLAAAQSRQSMLQHRQLQPRSKNFMRVVAQDQQSSWIQRGYEIPAVDDARNMAASNLQPRYISPMPNYTEDPAVSHNSAPASSYSAPSTRDIEWGNVLGLSQPSSAPFYQFSFGTSSTPYYNPGLPPERRTTSAYGHSRSYSTNMPGSKQARHRRHTSLATVAPANRSMMNRVPYPEIQRPTGHQRMTSTATIEEELGQYNLNDANPPPAKRRAQEDHGSPNIEYVPTLSDAQSGLKQEMSSVYRTPRRRRNKTVDTYLEQSGRDIEKKENVADDQPWYPLSATQPDKPNSIYNTSLLASPPASAPLKSHDVANLDVQETRELPSRDIFRTDLEPSDVFSRDISNIFSLGNLGDVGTSVQEPQLSQQRQQQQQQQQEQISSPQDLQQQQQ